MLTEELDYPLPESHIATAPAQPREAAKLMVIDRASGIIRHRHVRDLGTKDSPLNPNDLMVFNETRVLPASFIAFRSETGGRVQGLYLNSQTINGCPWWTVMFESRGTLREGERLVLKDADPPSFLELFKNKGQGIWRIQLVSSMTTMPLLEQIGQPPLPPYIRRARRHQGQDDHLETDIDRYNTVFAIDPGSIAAPTAALHFSKSLLAAIDTLGINRAMLTLHIGVGTFAPIRTQQVDDHPIHREWCRIPAATLGQLQQARTDGQRIIPIGTTCVRALESLPPDAMNRQEDYETSTGLLITPTVSNGQPFCFRLTDGLLTNFHLPRSTLLALVAALPGVGIERLKHWYQVAIDNGYRFYSYGDAMLLL